MQQDYNEQGMPFIYYSSETSNTRHARDNLLNFSYNTITDNIINKVFNIIVGPANFDNDNHMKMIVSSNIIWLPDVPFITVSGNYINVPPILSYYCNIANEIQSLNSGQQIFNQVINPLFSDSDNNNYHLSNTSPAIDYCDNSILPNNHNDLNGNIRGLDGANQNFQGTYDLGAYEYDSDLIFKQGFE